MAARHLFRINVAGRGYSLLVGNPLIGFQERPLEVESDLVSQNFLYAQNRIDEALASGILAWSMTFRCDDEQRIVVAYGCRTDGLDDRGRHGLTFLHGIELPATVSVYACVRSLVRMLSPSGVAQLAKLIDGVAAGTVGEDEFLQEVSGSVERHLASLPAAITRPHLPPGVLGVEHDCAGAAPLAWSLLSLVHSDYDRPWEVRDIVRRDGVIVSLSTLSSTGMESSSIVQASLLSDSILGSWTVTPGHATPGVKSEVTRPSGGSVGAEIEGDLDRIPSIGAEIQELKVSPPGRSLQSLAMLSVISLTLLLGIVIGLRWREADRADRARSGSQANPRSTPRLGRQGVRGGKPPVAPVAFAGGLHGGEAWRNPKDGAIYRWIPSATFEMGCAEADDSCDPDERPLHRVRISNGFWIGQTEVTVGEYLRYVRTEGGRTPEAPDPDKKWDDASLPMVNISWRDASTYCQRIGGRLPTEAEWELAARGPSRQGTAEKVTDLAWINSGVRMEPDQLARHPVGQKKANGYGVFDLLGNVWEWCADWFRSDYYSYNADTVTDPMGPASGNQRVLRGGSYKSGKKDIRPSNRYQANPLAGLPGCGFRCVVRD